MNRREFLSFVGKCGFALGIAGCATSLAKGDEGAKAENESRKNSIDKTAWDISPCGLNCSHCNVANSVRCQGCRGPHNQRLIKDCHFLLCSGSKGHRYCFECDDFPCKGLQEFASDGYPHHRQTVENMKKMREIGLDKWIAQQEKPVWCPGCNY